MPSPGEVPRGGKPRVGFLRWLFVGVCGWGRGLEEGAVDYPTPTQKLRQRYSVAGEGSPCKKGPPPNTFAALPQGRGRGGGGGGGVV